MALQSMFSMSQLGSLEGQNGSSHPQPGTSTDVPNTDTSVPDDIFDFYEKMDRDDDDDDSLKVVSFEIDQNHLETLQKRCVFSIIYSVWNF